MYLVTIERDLAVVSLGVVGVEEQAGARLVVVLSHDARVARVARRVVTAEEATDVAR